ncbi:hypothetical protein ACOSQ3_013549 [Xanthoceras sorbifolium]
MKNIYLRALEFPERDDNSDCIICIGSCNGLLCVTNPCRQIFLYNPSIKECKFIRYFGANSDGTSFIHGFGDDYKIVRIISPGNVVKVYSVRKSSWTIIESDLLFPEEYFKGGIWCGRILDQNLDA